MQYNLFINKTSRQGDENTLTALITSDGKASEMTNDILTPTPKLDQTPTEAIDEIIAEIERQQARVAQIRASLNEWADDSILVNRPNGQVEVL